MKNGKVEQLVKGKDRDFLGAKLSVILLKTCVKTTASLIPFEITNNNIEPNISEYRTSHKR